MATLAKDIWIVDGECVQFLGLPFSTRMTIIRLANGDIWVHSPIKLTNKIKTQLNAIGSIRYLIAPNHLHHLFLAEWIRDYPDAQVYGTNEVIQKRDDIAFTASLNRKQHWPWQADIEQELFSGSPLMEECVFYHKRSGTLIVTDLIENFSGKSFNYWQQTVAKWVGILAPNGKTPLDWRVSFMFGKAKARSHFHKILSWEPKRIVMAHGKIVRENAYTFLVESFKWLQ